MRASRAGWLMPGLQIRIAAITSGDPASQQALPSTGTPAAASGHGLRRVGQGAAQVALLGVAPAQRGAGAAAPARQQHAQRAGFGQAAQAAAVAGLAQGGLGRRAGMPQHALPAGGQRGAGVGGGLHGGA